MSFYVQRCKGNIWGGASFGYVTLYDAKSVANKLELGTSQPEVLRIVDEHGEVHAWVSRNGYMPDGALAPKTGSLPPSNMEWQVGKTAGEMSLIQFVFHVRQHLDPAAVTHIASKTREELLAEARWLLKWYGVEK